MSRILNRIPIQQSHLSQGIHKRQQIIYILIKHLHDEEGFGYRKISQWLNKSRIKTRRGKKWFNSSVISVLKKKHEREPNA